MKCELVYDGGDAVNIPSTWQAPTPDQFHGTPAEQLIEAAGRCCYSSIGTGRGSREYHQHLLEVKHHSVHEHYHVTVEVPDSDLSICPWVGIPDIGATWLPEGRMRLTFNLRHAIEWPENVSAADQSGGGLINRDSLDAWQNVLHRARHLVAPNLFPTPHAHTDIKLCPPQSDTEAFVSLWLEDSRVFSHEMVRHRFNISQRSGRFCDETDRDDCIHPLLRDYLNEAGYLALNQEDGPKLWCNPDEACTESEIRERTALGNAIGSHLAQGKMVYGAVCDKLQAWAAQRKGLDKLSARKQARSAARYYLPNALSTELVFTANIRNWRNIFKQRVNPAADQAIFELMEKAQEIVRGSRYGHLL